MVAFTTDLGTVNSSVCTIMQFLMEHLPAEQSIEKKEKEKQEKQLEETEGDRNEVYQPGSDEEMSSGGENEVEQIEVDEE